MSKIRVQGPENFGGFSHEGVGYTPDDDGVIEVPAHLPTEVLLSHGLKPAAVKVTKPLAKSAKGGDADSADPVVDDVDGKDAKPPVKGAKSAKGGEQ